MGRIGTKPFSYVPESRLTQETTRTMPLPGGHSPECFRLWEAIHAGAVPIVVFEDPLTGRKDAWFNCEDPLRPLLASGAPLVALDSWDDLYAFFDKFKTAFDLQAWVDVRQRRMRHWVQEFEAGAAAGLHRLRQLLPERLADLFLVVALALRLKQRRELLGLGRGRRPQLRAGAGVLGRSQAGAPQPPPHLESRAQSHPRWPAPEAGSSSA